MAISYLKIINLWYFGIIMLQSLLSATGEARRRHALFDWSWSGHMRGLRFVIALALLVLGGPLRAPAQTVAPASQAPDPHIPICQMIQSVARANALPVDFFTRLIWQESRFRTDEIGPLTHTGERALGIAQFMPGTAVERGLFEPFNPIEALPKSGEFLAELRGEFGNLGLAAAAYNAGPQRVRDYLTRLRELPLETRNYVMAITGRAVEDWVKLAREQSNEGFKNESPADHATSCEIMALLNQAPNSFVAQMQQRNVPSWCRDLRHPNVSICGSVHQQPTTSILSLVKLRGHLPVLGHHRADTIGPLRGIVLK